MSRHDPKVTLRQLAETRLPGLLATVEQMLKDLG